VRARQNDAIVLTQVDQLPRPLAPLVKMPVKYQDIQNRADRTTIPQRRETKSLAQRVNHREVVTEIHTHDDSPIGPHPKEGSGQGFDRVTDGRCVRHHRIGNAMNGGGTRGYRPAGVYVRAFQAHVSLRGAIGALRETKGHRGVSKRTNSGGFEIESHVTSHWERRSLICTNANEHLSQFGGWTMPQRWKAHR
jgi:hypothetical protein